MRVRTLHNELSQRQLSYLERIYTLTAGEEVGWPRSLHEERRRFISENYPLLRESLIEGIPMYEKPADWSLDSLSEGLDGEELEEMLRFIESIRAFTEDEWTLYPHQEEAIRAYHRGDHVVVATGTGSGKTECFLFPILCHLNREGKRTELRKQKGLGNGVMPRGIKAMVLYPMNALVADQLIRLRKMLGGLGMAEHLRHAGVGRYAQFGMYTGRTPRHGWYSKFYKKNGKWEYNNGVKNSIDATVKGLNSIQNNHPDLWNKMIDKGKIPAKGGTFKVKEIGDSGRFAQSFESLPPWAIKEARQSASKAGVEPESCEYIPVDNWGLKNFHHGLRRGGGLMNLGQKNDRELFARHEMHRGGIIQKETQHEDPSKFHSEEEMDELWKKFEHLGTPDVLVTNYSMLEYTLLRPLENIFWEETKDWLHETPCDGEPPRKFLLVLDEAHLYQGAMGTEVAMLLNRLRSVLSKDGKDAPIQIIMTSASLGTGSGDAERFAREITNISESEPIVAPQSIKQKMHDGPIDELPICNPEICEQLANLQNTPFLSEEEKQTLIKLSNTTQNEIDEIFSKFDENDEKRGQPEIRYHLLRTSSEFKRLYTLLHHPSEFNEFDENEKATPRMMDTISNTIFGSHHLGLEASEVLLDIIASARTWIDAPKDGMPLMPIRAHIFSRGMPRVGICLKCGRNHQLGTVRCDKTPESESCGGRVYELEIDRNTGEAFVTIWIKPTALNIADIRASTISPNATQTYQDGGPDDAGSNLLIGLSSWRCEHEHPKATHRIHALSGQLKWHEEVPEPNSDWISLNVPGFDPNDRSNWDGTRCWKNKDLKEDKQRRFFSRIQPCTERDYTHKNIPQISDMETRGDDVFSSLIRSLIVLQDPVRDLIDSRNKGKKCLIFSDGRQRAARLAARIGKLSFVDEMRRLVLDLHHTPWFISLPEKERTLARLYPWMILHAASLRVNPFDDEGGRKDRSLFSVHTIEFLSLFSAIALHEDSPERARISNWFESKGMASQYSSQDVNQAAKIDTFLRILHKQAKKIANADSNGKLKRSFFYRVINKIEAQTTNSIELPTILNRVENEQKYSTKIQKNFPGAVASTISDAREEITIIFDKIRAGNNRIYGLSRLISTAIRNENNHDLCSLENLSKCFIDCLTNSNFSDFFFNILLNDNQIGGKPIIPRKTKWNESWIGLLVYLCTDGYFGFEALGLASLACIDTNNSAIKFGLPRLFIGSNKDMANAPKSILDEESGFTVWAIKNFGNTGRFSPNIGIDETSVEVSNIIRDCLDDSYNESPSTHVIRDFLSRSNDRTGLHPDKVIIAPRKPEEPVFVCQNCLNPKITTQEEDPGVCISCPSDSFVDANEIDGSRMKHYVKTRIQTWMEDLKMLLSDPLKNDMAFLRAEEHTAQIGEKLDDEDLFSQTEIHEMQFQDLPIPSRTREDDDGVEHQAHLPPIDILSCTTTMEVGIDIGSLTAVALRTMPPQAANYQQRIGRAGRGSAEVAVALTWADNSAYAQQHFANPLGLITHPEEAPRLYLDNHRIKQRHLNATLFQRFLKSHNFNRITLTYDGMGGEADKPLSLFESLGTVNHFFIEDDENYGFTSFKKWCDLVTPGTPEWKHLIKVVDPENNIEEQKIIDWKNRLINDLMVQNNILETDMDG